MSEHPKDGGTAFPIETTATAAAPGLSMRDWFAGMAMNAMAADLGQVKEVADMHGIHPTALMARIAYDTADAMIAARTPPRDHGGMR